LIGGVPPGCPERDQLLPQGEAAHHRSGGEHERLHLPEVQGGNAAARGSAKRSLLLWRRKAWKGVSATLLLLFPVVLGSAITKMSVAELMKIRLVVNVSHFNSHFF